MASLLLDLVRGALPHVPLNKGVLQANTDTFLDALPLLTMLPMASVSSRGRAGASAALGCTPARGSLPLPPLAAQRAQPCITTLS